MTIKKPLKQTYSSDCKMNNSIIRSWNGKTIRQREDGYLSLTDMAQACSKRVFNWERLDSTKEYLEALSLRHYSDLSNGNLIEIIQGGTPKNQGTWGYRKVALRFAQWLSPDFAIQVDEWVEELLLTGKVTLDQATVERQKRIIGTWKQERTDGKPDRRSFTDIVQIHCPDDDNAYGKYTNLLYQFLLGTTTDKLRSLPVVDGIIRIGRNHIPEALQIHAVARAEELTAYYYEGALSLNREPSLTHAIWLACHEVKLSLDLPRLGKAKSKALTQFKLISTRIEGQYSSDGFQELF